MKFWRNKRMRRHIGLYFILFLLAGAGLRAQNNNVSLLGRWNQGLCYSVKRLNGYTFISNGSALEVYRKVNGTMQRLDVIELPGPALDMWLQDVGTHFHIFAACGEAGLQVVYFDLATHDLDSIIGTYDNDNSDGIQVDARGVMQLGGYIYIANGAAGFLVLDILQTPANPLYSGHLALDAPANDVWMLDNNNALVAADTAGLYAVSVANKYAPIVLDSLHFSPAFPEANYPGRSQPVAHHVVTFDSVTYVSAGWGGLWMIDARDLNNLQRYGRWTDSGPRNVLGAWKENNFVHLAIGREGFYAQIDVTNPEDPGVPAYLPNETGGFAHMVFVDQDTAYVADGNNGLAMFTVASSVTPSVIAHIETADLTRDATISGSYAYAAVGRSGLKIFDINIPTPPVQFNEAIGSYDTRGEARSVKKVGSRAYVADGTGGMTIVDVSNPISPVFVDSYQYDGDPCYDLDAPPGNYAFLACGRDGLRVLNTGGTLYDVLGNPMNTPGSARKVKVVDNELYLADSTGVYVYNISGLPSSPVLTRALTSGNLEALSLDVSGDTVFVANGQYGLALWNVNSGIVANVETEGRCTDVEVRGKTIYLTDSKSGLVILDFSVPGSILPAGQYNTGGNASGLNVLNEKVALADGVGGLYILQSEIAPEIVTRPTRLDFGPVPVGASRPLVLWVSNGGTTLLEASISVPANMADEFSFSPSSFSIPPNDSIKVVATFTPQSNYNVSNPTPTTATITSNDPDQPYTNITCEWLGSPEIGQDPYPVDHFTLGLWHLNEITGITAYDQTENHLDGQLNGGGVTLGQDGQFDTCVRFGGPANPGGIVVANDDVLNIYNQTFTVELWFQMASDISGYALLLRRGNDNRSQFQLALGADEGLMGTVWDADGVVHEITTGGIEMFNVGQWYHAAMTWDSDSLRLFLNSQFQGGLELRKNLRFEDTESLAMGRASLGNIPFNGFIDEVRLSKVARQRWEFHVNRSELDLPDGNVSFGNVLRGYSRRLPYQIRNTGADDLTLTSIASESSLITTDPVVSTGSPLLLEAEETRTIWVIYTPEDASTMNTILTFSSTDPTHPEKSVVLQGRGVVNLPTGAYNVDPFCIGLWHLDTAEGGVVVEDATVNDLDGVWNGLSPAGFLGKYSQALWFDGLNDFCYMEADPQVAISPRWGGFTAELWIQLDQILTGRRIILRRGGDNSGQFTLAMNGAMVEVAAFDNQQTRVTLSSTALEAQRWYHVAMVQGSDSLKLYVDGTLESKKPFSGEIAHGSAAIDTLALQVGRTWDGNLPFYGRMDEIRLSSIERLPWEFNVNMARADVDSTRLRFGDVYVGGQRKLSFYVSNQRGIDVLDIHNIFTIQPDIFTISPTGFSVQPGDSQRVEVTYKPQNAGPMNVDLLLETNDPSYTPPNYLTIVMSGAGITEAASGPYETDYFTRALYHFDEAQGDTIFDHSSRAGFGRLYAYGTNPLTQRWVTGRFNGALYFDGSDDRVVIGQDPFGEMTRPDFTLETWLSLSRAPQAGVDVLLKWGTGDKNQMELMVTSDTLLQFSVWDSAGVRTDLIPALGALDLSRWYQAALKGDGNTLSFYLNNEPVATTQYSARLVFDGEKSMTLGTDAAQANHFAGALDELRISTMAREFWELNVKPATISVYPDELSFSPGLAGLARTLKFWVANQGDQQLTVQVSPDAQVDEYSTPDEMMAFSLGRNQSIAVPVTYLPNVPNESHQAQWTLTSNDTLNASVTVDITGTSTDAKGVDEYSRDERTVVLYHFNETDIDTVFDSSGKRWDGVMHNGPLLRGGYFKRALLFDGLDDYVEIPYLADFSFDFSSESFTIECFFRTDTVSHTLLALGYWDKPDSLNFGLAIDEFGRLTAPGFGTGPVNVSDNSWHHGALTYNHVNQRGHLYVDGESVFEGEWTGETALVNELPLIVGAASLSDGTVSRHFQGAIDEVRISTLIREAFEFPIVDYGIGITASTPAEPVLGQALNLRISVPEVVDPEQVRLRYRAGGGEADYEMVLATPAVVDTYTVDITGSYVTLQGLEYFVEVITNTNDTLTYPVIDPENNPVGVSVTHSGLDSDLELLHRKFQMISIPFDLDSTSVRSVLEDDLGGYDPFNWRLFYWQTFDTTYVDYRPGFEGNFGFTLGRAFWITTQLDQTFDIGAGSTVSTDTSFALTVFQGTTDEFSQEIIPGWNMIGSPFNFPVRWDDCFLSSDSITGIYSWDGTAFNPNEELLEPWKGYFICNLGLTPIQLTIPPIHADRALAKKRPALHKKARLTDLGDEEWLIRLAASVREVNDAYNYVGVKYGACEEWDVNDRPEPPPVDGSVSLQLNRRQWKTHPGVYLSDIRAPGDPGYVFDVQVACGLKDESVTLTWEMMNSLPPDWEAYLLDGEAMVSYNLLKEKALVYSTEKSAPGVRSYTLLVGSHEFIEHHRGDIPLVPVKFELSQNYPNPFNPETTIRFGVPKRTRVRLVIYNALGQEVTILKDETMNTGRHQVIWRGEDHRGVQVSSGVYFCRFKAAGKETTRKMIFIK